MVPFSRPSQWQYLEGTCHEIVHTWRRSCAVSNLELTAIVIYEGFKIYLPLYLFSEFLRHRSLSGLLKVVPHVLRSSLFLGSHVGFSLLFLCVVRHLIGRYYHQSALLSFIVGSGCAVMVERPVRRPLLAGYVATIGIESLYSHFKQMKMVSSLPYGEVLLFSLATAILFHRFRTEPTGGGLVNSILSGLMSPTLPPIVMNYLQSTCAPWNNRLTRIILVGVWAFLLGYLIQILPSLLNQRTRLLKKRGALKRTLIHSIKFAAFLSSLAAGYKLVSNLLYHLRLPRDIRLLLAGLVAGLSMLFYRSSSLSLYVAWKALEVLYSRGVDKGWLRYLPYGEVLIYALATGWLLYGWFYEAHNMRWAYWHFLRRISWGRLLLLNFSELDKFGTGASTRIKEWKDIQNRQIDQ